MRERFFTPRLRFKNLEELNASLLDHASLCGKASRSLNLSSARSDDSRRID
ncbi:hypothetical protein IVB33_38740 [Bradyrhizobium sp. 24]|nr:hypothetical protein [Bradyrhizobium sp. 37]MCK1353619.1 hypothetical protein [Bradyrhizobium sp. CW7]MCK1382329.1 hypothetical protein [Bradyrhizobium sp. 24]MCK1505443.1 hypothetical protein [Bradyrhizobium sp. 18]MCK1576886.1 hypothetical protein [Bradyrhizobium sp. 174]MCK1587170.1 hypothetical protein [Bradyrhizobium sp. 169]MCK1676386.1 hypothetical protein [Bradyrhizobium sp. 150]MCK1692431.1 hypothetical protein [Bradyrhizobium sp. 144]MCK1705235.1 hypothetical protein [Bradyrhiz